MKGSSTTQAPPFARKVNGHLCFEYSKAEINNCINGIARELRTCPEDKFIQLVKVLTTMKML